MLSLQFANTVFTMFYTTTMIAFTSLQLMGLDKASSLSNPDVSPNAHYFFYQNSEYPRDCKDVQRQCSSENSSGVYLIKPDGLQEPFEVFCDNDIESGGWTVIERRGDGIVNFNRNWTHYKDGFGFLSTEFFLGNERVSYLTNQAVYELLIEAELENGCSFHTIYEGFRIADEYGQYTLQVVRVLESNASQCESDCPANVFFINGCTEKCTCTNNRLDECIPVSCDVNAVCDEMGMCSCNDGYEGDGLTCTAITTTAQTTTPTVYTDCKEAFDDDRTQDGVFKIRPTGWTGQPFDVFCDMDNGGGWTVFQRRQDDSQSFYQNWTMYKEGFGDINANFWLGNEKIFYLTNQNSYKLRLDIITSDGTPLDAEYAEFQIEDENSNYRMNKLGTRSSTSNAGNGFGFNLGDQFSTYDRDNDECSHFDCAEKHQSGWWHGGSSVWCSSCYATGTDCHTFPYNGNCHSLCTSQNLNGVYNGGNGERIFTYYNNFCNPQTVELKIRPIS